MTYCYLKKQTKVRTKFKLHGCYSSFKQLFKQFNFTVLVLQDLEGVAKPPIHSCSNCRPFFTSLTDDDCTDSFTLNQVARMHCYLDLVYQTWQPNYKPSVVPMAPHVVDQGQDTITIEWIPPLTGHVYDR